MTDLEGLYTAHVTTLVDRTSAALERTGYDRLVVHAGDLVKTSRFDDLEYPFRPVPAFAHWVPWPWPGSALLLEKGRSARLLARRRTDFWERLEAPEAELVRAGLDVAEVDQLDEASEWAKRKRTAFVGESPATGMRLGFDEAALNPAPLVAELHELRVHKTPYEVETLAEANRQAVRGHRAIAEAFAAGERSELALNLAYLAAIEQDATETPYQNIVALGTAASVLHHHHYGRRPGAASLLVDAGAATRGYGADVTRTHVAPGDPTPFAALVDAMDRLQREVVGRIEVGKGYEQLHDEAHALLGRLLVEAEMVGCSAEAAVETGLTRVFFPHGLGHSLGVQVHDVGCLNTPPRAEIGRAHV